MSGTRSANPDSRLKQGAETILTELERIGVFTGAAEAAKESTADWARRVLLAVAMRPFGGQIANLDKKNATEDMGL